MAMLAGARSLHARPWERRYRHAFGGWFERGRLNLRAGEEPFLRDPRDFSEIAGKSQGEFTGRFRRCTHTGTKRRNARPRIELITFLGLKISMDRAFGAGYVARACA